jgi:hypothetical protein
MHKFKADLKFGQKYEKILLDLIPHDSHILSCGYCKEYDFKMIRDGKEYVYEVKADRRSINTGNMVIEYECSDKPSGITTTQACCYAYFVVRPLDQWDLYLIPTDEIRRMIKDKEFKRTIKGGDGMRSRMYVIGLNQVQNFKYDTNRRDDDIEI